MKPKKIIKELNNAINTLDASMIYTTDVLNEQTEENFKKAMETMKYAIDIVSDYKKIKKENKELKEQLEGKKHSSKKESTKEEKAYSEKAYKLLDEVEKAKDTEPIPSPFGNVDIKSPFEGLELEAVKEEDKNKDEEAIFLGETPMKSPFLILEGLEEDEEEEEIDEDRER